MNNFSKQLYLISHYLIKATDVNEASLLWPAAPMVISCAPTTVGSTKRPIILMHCFTQTPQRSVLSVIKLPLEAVTICSYVYFYIVAAESL